VALARFADRPCPDEEEVELALAQLAADGGPLRRELARIAGRIVTTEAWARLGFARLGDYARECAGLSGRELSDLARVDGKLRALPRLEAALIEGRLGWTAVRLLCRVATPADEHDWIATARAISTRDLGLRVRSVERTARATATGVADAVEPAELETLDRLRIPCMDQVPRKWGDVRRLLRRTTGEWLPWAACAEYMAAEVMSGLPFAADPAGAAHEASAGSVRPARIGPSPPDPRLPRLRLAGALSPFVDALGKDLGQADPFELDRRMRGGVALERDTLRRMGPLLAVVADARIYRSLGLHSLNAYARERLGMSPHKARALLRVERACCRSPALRRAWQQGILSWSQAQVLVTVVTAPGSERWHARWIERAAAVSLRRLEDDVDDAPERGEFDPALLPLLPELGIAGHSGGPEGVQMRARPRHWRERTRVVICASPEVVRLFRACLARMQLVLERARNRPVAPGEALEAMCDQVIETWTAGERRLTPAERRTRQVYERDGWRCTVPGCRSYRNLQAHHIRFRSRGGGDEATNLTTLCAAHHHRAVHTSRIRIQGSAPDSLRFDMPLDSWLSGDRRIARADTRWC